MVEITPDFKMETGEGDPLEDEYEEFGGRIDRIFDDEISDDFLSLFDDRKKRVIFKENRAYEDNDFSEDYNGEFGENFFEYEAAVELFDYLGLEKECSDPKFVKWLRLRDVKNFEDLKKLVKDFNHDEAAKDIRDYYDQYRKERLNYFLKRAGIASVVAISLISLVTGLSLGLKRKGKDMVYDAEEKWKKLNPSKRTIPWLDLEKATGEVFIEVGNNIYIVIGGVVFYLYAKRN